MGVTGRGEGMGGDRERGGDGGNIKEEIQEKSFKIIYYNKGFLHSKFCIHSSESVCTTN